MQHLDTMYWLEVHLRFTKGDFAAWKEIAAYFLPWLSQRLSYRRPDVDIHLIAESAENALLLYLDDPWRFDATRGVPLHCWLLFQARGQLSNLLRHEQSHKAKERAVGVADKIFEKKLSEMGREMTIYIGRDENEIEEQQRSLYSLLPRLSLLDRARLELLYAEAPFGEWAEQLRIAYLPTAEQHHKVNAEKQRLRKKLRRLARRLGLSVPAKRGS